MIRVVTGIWGDAWDRYGKQFHDTFLEYWPKNHELIIYNDDFDSRIQSIQRKLSCINGYDQFKSKYKHNKAANGMGYSHAKTDSSGCSWRHNAYKWFPQGLIPEDASKWLKNGELLVWMDADVHTFKSVPLDWVGNLLGESDVACLQREGTHTEIGFYAIRISHETKQFLKTFSNVYKTGEFLRLKESHSAFVFDYALSKHNLKVENLNDSNKRGHVWPASKLSRFTVHKKGKRKNA